ncbi:mCG141089, partial [Mus musculus]
SDAEDGGSLCASDLHPMTDRGVSTLKALSTARGSSLVSRCTSEGQLTPSRGVPWIQPGTECTSKAGFPQTLPVPASPSSVGERRHSQLSF